MRPVLSVPEEEVIVVSAAELAPLSNPVPPPIDFEKEAHLSDIFEEVMLPKMKHRGVVCPRCHTLYLQCCRYAERERMTIAYRVCPDCLKKLKVSQPAPRP